MLSIVKSMALQGLDGYLVSVQVDISEGMPNFEMVGLPDTSVKESKERVRTAIKNSGIKLLSRKLVVNFAPANTKKEGSKFDLPIAIGILISSEKIQKNQNVEKTNGILPICIEAKKLGIKRIVLSKQNAKEASIVEGLEILAIQELKEIIEYLNGENYIQKQKNQKFDLTNQENYEFDFSEVKGQETVKRALEISAAGGHNCLLIGAPGSGKTMLAQRLPSILPNLSFEESLEVTKIHSISGILAEEEPPKPTRPFRSPPHTITSPSLVGGGKNPKPGEISLAHNGVLFLDELPEFNQKILELLRGPLEDKKITISRLNISVTYPCNFIFIASMNPCPCGNYGSQDKECTCKPQQIKNYLNKISGPLLDRIDLHIEVEGIEYKKFESSKKEESSKEIRNRVNLARKIQLERYKNENIYSNSELTPKLMEKYCKIDERGKRILEKAFENLKLSARAYTRILKVSRTIADLENSKNIQSKHIIEAVQYRSLDRKYWGR